MIATHKNNLALVTIRNIIFVGVLVIGHRGRIVSRNRVVLYNINVRHIAIQYRSFCSKAFACFYFSHDCFGQFGPGLTVFLVINILYGHCCVFLDQHVTVKMPLVTTNTKAIGSICNM